MPACSHWHVSMLTVIVSMIVVQAHFAFSLRNSGLVELGHLQFSFLKYEPCLLPKFNICIISTESPRDAKHGWRVAHSHAFCHGPSVRRDSNREQGSHDGPRGWYSTLWGAVKDHLLVPILAKWELMWVPKKRGPSDVMCSCSWTFWRKCGG